MRWRHSGSPVQVWRACSAHPCGRREFGRVGLCVQLDGARSVCFATLRYRGQDRAESLSICANSISVRYIANQIESKPPADHIHWGDHRIRYQGQRAGRRTARWSRQSSAIAFCGCTSRTRQEPTLSHRALAPVARVVFATRGLRDRKALANSVGVKNSFSQIEPEEKKSRPFQNGHSKPSVRKARTWTRPQPKSLGFGHLPVVNSKGEPNFRHFCSETVRADFDADWRI